MSYVNVTALTILQVFFVFVYTGYEFYFVEFYGGTHEKHIGEVQWRRGGMHQLAIK